MRSDLVAPRPKRLVECPRSFKCFALVHDRLHAHDLAAAQGEKHEIGRLALDPTRPTRGALDDYCEDGVPYLAQLRGLDRELFPLSEEPKHVLADSFGTDPDP